MQTKYHYSDHNSVIFQHRDFKFSPKICFDNTHTPNHTKPNQTIQNQTKPNITIMTITQSICKLEASDFTW